MKNLIVIGISNKGQRTTQNVKVTRAAEVTTNPAKFGFAKISSICTEEMFNKSLGIIDG